MSHADPYAELPPQRYDVYGQPIRPVERQLAAAPFTSGKATAALVLGILTVLLGGLIFFFFALRLSRKAIREIDESRGRMSGRGMARTGYWLAWVGMIGWVVVGLFVLH